MRNDPSFSYDDYTTNSPSIRSPGLRGNMRSGQVVKANKTDAGFSNHQSNQQANSENTENAQVCPVHGTNHSLNMCRAFRNKTIDERKKFLQENGLCFKCCGPRRHIAKNCRRNVVCGICKSTNHPAALHIDKLVTNESTKQGEKDSVRLQDQTREKLAVSASCLNVCGNPESMSKSCAKTILVRVHSESDPNNVLDLYATIDDQSNRTLAKPKLFDHFGIHGPEVEYSLTSCSGTFQQAGRRAHGLIVSSYDGNCNLRLPTVIECEQIPDDREEIPTPDAARAHYHLMDIEDKIPPIDPRADILLLIGRDLLRAHHVLDQRLGSETTPYAQQLPLGWVIVGEACFGASHSQEHVSSYKTFILGNGRPSCIQPCENEFNIKEPDIFVKTSYDNLPSLSVEDRKFLSDMDSGIHKGEDGCWCLPLPFKENRRRLPNNRPQAIRRANLLTASLKKNPAKRDHVVEFMDKLFKNGHAELAPALKEGEEHWFLPLFAVYHPKKPGSVRCVFDSSAKCEGVSLNDILLTGPDLLNSLLGILMRFRLHSVAVSADVEQMFYRFSVPSEHRNFLRFMWHKENDIDQNLVEYRMKRHVFGNSPSPAVANFGMCKTVEEAALDVRQFVEENFYVDDGLTSVDTSEEAISLLQRTQSTLKDYANIRLHKIVSNDINVLNAFPIDDLAKDITTYNLELNETPPQRSLGVSWDVATDKFTFQVSKTIHPFTKRGVLATINSLYDPIGFLAPVVIRGKLIMRDIMSAGLDWDDPLPSTYNSQWSEWRESLSHLEGITVPRTYADLHSASILSRDLHIFCDASQNAIAAVAYMKIYDVNGLQHISFVHGKVKVAPKHGHTIPRLELCAAVLATQIKDTITQHLKCDFKVSMYTDSKIVLGYLNNTKRRFYVYVDNRVSQIRQSTTADQWTYVPSAENPADIATRSLSPKEMSNSMWLHGPPFIMGNLSTVSPEGFELVNPDQDTEVRLIASVKSAHTDVTENTSANSSLAEHLKNFSRWSRLVRTEANLQHIAQSYSGQGPCRAKGWHFCPLSTYDLQKAEKLIIKNQQYEYFKQEIDCLRGGKALPRSCSILPLTPYLDKDGVLCVAGRLGQAKEHLSLLTVNPIIIPKKSHIATLLVRHFHTQVNHQGCRITEGRLRSAGYWIVGVKRLIKTIIHSCITCKILRGRLCSQKMADLPIDRLTPGPPFSFVGLDTFGPWNVVSRKTRGGLAHHKRWAILFTCLVCRAIHIEVVEELSTSSFINALRRFFAVRGPVRQFRSDRGTNFVGAVHELNISAKFIEDGEVKQFLNDNACSWIFNPPHASHFGGSWERMIGISRKILDAMLLKTSRKDLTHETLTTFLSEVTAIVNSRPLTSVSEDPSDLVVLTPSMLLTQKSGQLPDCIPSLSPKDIYKAQWRHVQLLADEFWKRWQKDYLSQIQGRVKWTDDVPNVNEGDVVLMRDPDNPRYNWPLAIITRTFPSDDCRIRKVELRVSKDNKCTMLVRPVHEIVPLLA
ncbi:hypothetical protein FSP39_021786 [Pinctada imbricata]|uniref:Integrase catalytic domain-containing protein n=1 Tax=Pinctada imbricata TaxID=66713 RepID=A0AA88XJ71_PINIB|nr:hypothetical protein FSP39_021786 [Pinctada imbricata]